MKTNGRDYHGRFALGNPGGPGRPPTAKEHAYLETLGAVCTVDDWRSICCRAVRDARNGDRHARNWLSKYLLGDNQQLADLPAHDKPNSYDDLPADLLLELRGVYARIQRFRSNATLN